MAKNEKLTFERAAERLEEIVRLLENGKAPLDDSLKLYEEGISLVRFCNETLEGAEKKIKILTVDENGVIAEKDFKEE